MKEPPEAGLPLSRGVRVLRTHESGLVALEKPADVRSHPNQPGADPRSLLVARYDPIGQRYFWTDPGSGRDLVFHLLHRLDAPTSGVMIGARDADLADLIREEFRAGRVRKTYQAVVKPDRRGAVEKVWRDSLRKVPGGARGVKIQRQPGGEPAVTRVLRFSFGGGELGCAFLEVSPETGRTHQIRVQSALRGYPVVGDRTYGNFRFNRRAAAQTGYKRLFLHAVEITLAVVFKGERIEFSAAAPQPPEFEELLG